MQIPSLGWEDPLEKGRQPTRIFLPGEFHGQRSLVGYSPEGRKRVGHNLVTEQQNNILYLDSVMLVTEVTTSVKTQTVNLDGVMFYYIKRTISTKLT